MVYPGEIDNQLQHFAVQGAAMGRHYEQLIPEERATIMMMKASNCTVRHMASVLLPSTSTIKRELARLVLRRFVWNLSARIHRSGAR